jgi:hypothetical protein
VWLGRLALPALQATSPPIITQLSFGKLVWLDHGLQRPLTKSESQQVYSVEACQRENLQDTERGWGTSSRIRLTKPRENLELNTLALTRLSLTLNSPVHCYLVVGLYPIHSSLFHASACLLEARHGKASTAPKAWNWLTLSDKSH